MNSTTDRLKHEALTKQYGPGPGHYAVNSAFQNKYISSSTSRKILSQEQGSRIPGKLAKTTHSSHRDSMHNRNDSKDSREKDKVQFGHESGYPSYTVRENGLLRKRLQPFAAD